MTEVSTACSPSAAQEVLNSLSLGATIGVSYIGVALSALVYGITCCQMFYYFRSEKAKRDTLFLKALVTFLMLVSTLQEAFIMHTVYYYAVINFANPCALVARVVWTIPSEILLGSIISMGVEGFLVYRIWKLGRNVFTTVVCAVLVAAASVMKIVYPASFLAFPGTILEALKKFLGIAAGALGVGVAADVAIAAVLIFYLHRHKTGFRRSDGLVTRLIVLTVSTGALSSAVVAADLIAYALAPAELYVLFFNFLVGKMYINILLTTLNMRGVIGTPSGQSTTQGINSIPLRNIGPSNSARSAHLDVRVDRTVEIGKYDNDKPRSNLGDTIVVRTSMTGSIDGTEGETV